MMKQAMERFTDRMILVVLLVLLLGGLVLNLLLPQNIISFALLGLAVIATLYQLKKTNLKL
nr:hypothetical protein [uncultured Flavobacterium sp.]